MKALFPTRFAEIIYALVLIAFAYGHFSKADAMADYIPAYMPGSATIWVYVTGAGLGLAAIAIIFNIQKTLACYLLAAMLLVFVFTMHLQPAMDGNMTSLLKDIAMAMAAIIIGNNGAKS